MRTSMLGPKMRRTVRRDLPTGQPREIQKLERPPPKKLPMSAAKKGIQNPLSLYRRAMACHDVGFARDENGRMILNDPDLWLWGKGCRLDEFRASILRVQLRKMPATIQRMNHSKYRVRRALEKFPQVRLRKIMDPQGIPDASSSPPIPMLKPPGRSTWPCVLRGSSLPRKASRTS